MGKKVAVLKITRYPYITHPDILEWTFYFCSTFCRSLQRLNNSCITKFRSAILKLNSMDHS